MFGAEPHFPASTSASKPSQCRGCGICVQARMREQAASDNPVAAAISPAAVTAMALADRLATRAVPCGTAARIVASRCLRRERLASRFDRAEAMLAPYAGLSPRHRRSGTSIHGRTRLCKTGNSRLRKALYMPAIVALRFNPVLKVFADRFQAAGKHKRLIIGAVMRNPLVLAYGILRSGVAFAANHA
jgi:ferredoxin